ncbi:MAG: SPOR domain-containing protein [Ectothiorhodospiraceae bacterium]|nr:SPOR domain-containing protein [Ectothiorhodospiraceae bacterium]
MAKAARRKPGTQARRRKSSSRGAVPGWLWMLGGFLPGVFLAVLVHLHHTQDGVISSERAGGAAIGRDGAGDSETDHRPRFEFYKLLSEMEVVVPDEPAPPRRQQEDSPVATPAVPTTPTDPSPTPGGSADDAVQYVVQAGSFRSHNDADRLKARLALMGVEAEIQSVTIDGGGTWHRVRIGPIADRSRVDRVRQRLEQEQVDSILLRVQG